MRSLLAWLGEVLRGVATIVVAGAAAVICGVLVVWTFWCIRNACCGF